jgi:hypothetical protein
MAKKESLFGMLRKGKDYETEQTKRTKAHPIRKRAQAIENIERMKKDLMAPVETEEERKRRLQREKEARARAKRKGTRRGTLDEAVTKKELKSMG